MFLVEQAGAATDAVNWTWTAVNNVGEKCFGSTRNTLETSLAVGTTMGGTIVGGVATGGHSR